MRKAKIKPFPLRISDDLKDFLTQVSNSKGIARNTLITNLLWEYKGRFENEQKNR